jgi:type I restriction-modification system DNA methylase subunit
LAKINKNYFSRFHGMSLFQNSVLASYKQDEALIASRWAAYQNFLAKTKAIREFKEEEYQEGFLKDVFESCLGYTLKTTDPANFTLERETKNETDSKKADGAIYVGDKVTGVIELKAQNTQNLDKATDQAFGYLTKNSHAKYVIVSNFDELRFYVEKATDYEKFHLFTLDYEGFKKLHLILSYESIAKELPHAMKQKSHNFEQEISKQLYKDFSAFRTHLFENILKNNDLDHTTLLRLTQKLCDRIIFILFAEDRGLLNPNTIKEIRSRHADDIMGNPIYGYYKIYFDAINKGNEKLAIPKYNGGLFAPDALLESLVIDDAYLDMEAQKLSDYDFASDISVNILGHIFEQSLTDLEELQAQIENADFDKKQGKRKKDGVFYTPEYITRYIVGNTLGRLCEEKKVALSLLIEAPAIANPKKLTKEQEKHKQNILDYRAWLENLKILDPACGSGAFLNQALEFLIREHTAVRDRLLPFQDLTLNYEIETAILEHNLYGVDINEDAVEIARLSLWLRTAQRGRTLTDLSGKIVCANSLLAMPFEEGSFDIVIGNPPYFNIQKFGAKSPIVQTIQTTYSEIWQDKSDILFYFIALAIKMTKNKVGFIISNAFMFSDKAKKLRNYILENTTVSKITNFEQYMVFEDASITSAIIELDKIKTNKRTKAYNFIEKNYNQSDVYDMLSNKANYFEVNLKKDNVFALVDDKINTLNEKIDSSYSKLNTIFKIGKGMETAANNVFQFKEYPTKFPKEFIKKRMSGEIIKKYTINETKEYLLYFEDITTFEELPQSIQNHLLKNKEFLENRAQIKRSKTSNWWKYTFPMHKEFYSKNKLWCSYRAKENIFCFDNTAEYIGFTNTTVIFDTHESLDLKYLLALLNSKTLNFRYKSIGKQTGSGVYEYFENGVGKLPIPEIDRERQQPFIKLVDEILEVKQKIKDYKTLFDEAHNTNNFDREIKLKKEIEILESRAMACEHEIDAMVYKLYNLTDEEIKIVENSNER